MTGPGFTFGTIVRVNARLAAASILVLTGWAIWPDSAEWWGFGLLAVYLDLMAFALAMQAGRDALGLYARDRAIAALQREGEQAKADRLASADALVAKRMIGGR